MRTQQKLRLAGLILALLTPFLLAQQDDTPVVITDGSLKLVSTVPWGQYTPPTGDTRHHPHTGKTVSSVTITINGSPQTITYSRELCKVDVTYGSDHVVFETNSNGKGLRMRPRTHFVDGGDPDTIVHSDPSKKIAHVTITKGSGNVVDKDATSGVTRIEIHYKTQ